MNPATPALLGWRQVAKAVSEGWDPSGDPNLRVPGYAVDKEPPFPPLGGKGERRLTWPE